MYRVFKRDEGSLKHITSKMQPYIVSRGEKIVKDDALQKEPIKYIDEVIKLMIQME